jgi:DNA excision repair protein ERCC-6
LSQHMSICQTTRTRGQRRTSMESTRRAAAVAVNYSESTAANDSDSDDGDDDDADVTPTSDDGDDEVLIADDVSNDGEGKVAKTKASRKRTRKSLPPAPRQTKVIDDWDKDDYEDRVYEWMETGVQGMKDMKERDLNETPPGEAVYDGGLVVPAWINDRLFPYQRTAMQWMWELHQQQAGGIIGDEMGLVCML